MFILIFDFIMNNEREMTSHAGHAIIALPCHFVRSLSIARDRGRFARLISQLLMAYTTSYLLK